MKTFAFCFIFAVSVTVQAQQPNIETGSPQELKGVQRVYVNATKYNKKRIEQVIKKDLPTLQFVEDRRRADAVISFHTQSASFPATNDALSDVRGVASSSMEYEITVTGQVMKRVAANQYHQLLDFTDSRRSMYEPDMATRFAQIFIRSYKAAN